MASLPLKLAFGGSDPVELPDGKCSRVCRIDDLR